MAHIRTTMALAVALAAPVAASSCLNTSDTGTCYAIPVHNYNVGDVATDTLSGQACRQLYEITAGDQTNMRVTLTSPGFQTFLQLIDSRGAIVMNSVLTNAVDTTTTVRLMLGPGTYSLAVNPINAGQGGAYRLTSAVDSAAVGGCSRIWVTPGITTTQRITTGDCTQSPNGASYYTHVYNVVLLVGQSVTVTESSTSFSPGFVLYGPSSSLPSTVDSTGTTASISTVIDAQGAYSVWVGSSNAGQTGMYTLQIQ